MLNWHTHTHRHLTSLFFVFLFLLSPKEPHCWCGEDFKFLRIKDKLEMCRNVKIKRSKTFCMFGSKFVMTKKDFKIQQNVSRLPNSAFQFCAGVEKFLSALDGDSSTVIFWVSVSTLTCFPHTSSWATLKRFSNETGQIFMSLWVYPK